MKKEYYMCYEIHQRKSSVTSGSMFWINVLSHELKQSFESIITCDYNHAMVLWDVTNNYWMNCLKKLKNYISPYLYDCLGSRRQAQTFKK